MPLLNILKRIDQKRDQLKKYMKNTFTLEEIKKAILQSPTHIVKIQTPPNIDGNLDDEIETIEIDMFLSKLLASYSKYKVESLNKINEQKGENVYEWEGTLINGLTFFIRYKAACQHSHRGSLYASVENVPVYQTDFMNDMEIAKMQESEEFFVLLSEIFDFSKFKK
jgi:hypothetical protein